MENLNELFTALSLAQSEIKGAVKDSTNPYFKSKYANLASVWEAVRVPLTKNGLSIAQVFETNGDKLILTTILGHKSGQSLSSHMELPIGQKRDPQTLGSLISYCRRYSLASICSLPSIDDDDAERAQEEYRITASQLEEIKNALNGNRKLADSLLKFYKISKFSDLNANDYEGVLKTIAKSNSEVTNG